MPKNKRDEINAAFKGLPLNKNPLTALIDLASIHSKSVLGKHNKVAIIGPANVGKSTLFNQFVRGKAERAEVSPIPGTTRVNQETDAGIFLMVDTPGADVVGRVGAQEKAHALDAARSADFIIMVFDAIQGVKQSELDLYEEILAYKKPHIIVLNKMDLVNKFRQEVLNRTAASLGVDSEQLVPVSALKGDGIGEITMSIIAAAPSMTLALANAMPEYRRKIAWRSIATSSSLAAAISLTPLPVIDFIPLLATQVGMVINIARIFQYKITPARAKELIGTFGLGMLGRTLFQQLSKLGGVPGWLLSAGIAAGMTTAMGYAAIEWFEKGERISSERMREISKTFAQSFTARMKDVFKKKPSRREMQKAASEILAEVPGAASEQGSES